MADITVPTLGESITEAIVARWLKQPGEAVAADEALVELETDKVTLEVNAPAAGVLAEVAAATGATVAVGALLGRIEANGQATAAAPAPKPARREDPKPAEQAPARREEPKETEQPARELPPDPERRAAPAAKSDGQGGGLEIVVPTLGESVTEAIVARWLKQPGEAVGADEPLVELETDKVTLEVNAPAAGTLAELKAAAGATVAVGALLALFVPGGRAAVPPRPAAPVASAPAPAAAPAPAPAPGPARAAAADPRLVARTAPGGKIGANDLVAFLTGQALSPAVQRLVSEHGMDAQRIPASGKDGRLTKEDVLKALEDPGRLKPAPMARQDKPAVSLPGAAVPGAAVPGAPPPRDDRPAPAAAAREERVRMTKLRQTVARRLKEAQNTAALLTTFNEVDMSAVLQLRSEHKEAFEKAHGVKLGFTAFFAKAAVAALKAVPAVNARIEGEEIVYARHYDLGMAVSTPQGLMVPVIRDCDAKSFAEIEQALGDLAARARDGKLKLDELQGGTFTITNGGVFGSLLSTPIINPPQSAILGLHKIEERPVAQKGQVVVRPMMYLAVSYDHRLIDGREAVTFLVKVKEAIEQPERLLLGL